MERTIKGLEFIRNTLREEYKSLSVEDLNEVLKFVYEEQIRNGEPLASLQTLKSARILCELCTGKEVVIAKESPKNRTNIIKEDDEYALIFKRAFRMLSDMEQGSIIENKVKSDVVEFTEDYVRASISLINIIKQEDEYLADMVQQALLPAITFEKEEAITIEELGRTK